MQIVVLDGYTENPGDLSWDGLEELGDLTVYDRTPTEFIEDRIGNAEMVITNKTPISRETMKRCPDMKYIGVLATGYNVIDVKAAEEQGIIVTNIPTYGTAAVGQYTIALLLELCHHIGHHSQAVHDGRWENNIDWCFWDYPLIELAGKTMGIIGFGRIGETTGKIAAALGMQILAYDTIKKETDVAEYVELEELFQRSDVIVLHCPLFENNKEMINRESISKMKDGVIIINDSRGGLIREQDLADALNSGKVFGAAVDVVSTEPIRGDNPLLTAKNCLITPHIAWASKESRERLMSIAVENAQAYINGQPIHTVHA
ncbi:D-2-hydroxyacid dehydrogenase [Massiliimalia massiliensis]|uniref:D-2-hydroxyacid dehydrogenase n=1 Tax=Massiliimalia massiliensis TaxID=1852384 RepID=UPI0009864230|nr:D-2-hydroxyacid dehydrogenase [Massiliimalia massiliensis]